MLWCGKICINCFRKMKNCKRGRNPGASGQDENHGPRSEIYKFQGVEQTDGITTKEVYNRVKEEVNRRLQILAKTELNDKNLIKAINTKVIPVAAYPMNVCKFTKENSMN